MSKNNNNHNKLSLMARFDDHCREAVSQLKAAAENYPKLKFIIAKTEENRIKWLQAETELRDAKKQISQLTDKNKELESKLQRLRQAYGREVYKTQDRQKDNEKLKALLDLVRKTVNQEDFRGSKESLHTVSSEAFDYMMNVLDDPETFLKSKPRKSDIIRPSRSYDNIDVSDLFDKTDDSMDNVLDDQPVSRRTRTSAVFNDTVIPSTQAKKFRADSSTTGTLSDHIEHDLKTDSENEFVYAKMDVNQTPLEVSQAQSEISQFPLEISQVPHEISYTPSAYTTPKSIYSTNSLRRNHSARRPPVPTDLKRLDSRPHKLVQKKVFKGTSCNACNRAIKFCSNVLICESCRSIAHLECGSKMPLPCIQHFSPKKTNRPLIGDFVDRKVRPFIPPLLIYCCKEIEEKHLKEEGIYRQCGSDSRIRELKNEILKSKSGCPYLGDNPHDLCGVVKSFLKDLSDSLVTSILWKDFFKASDSSNPDELAFLRLINRLPDANRDVLAFMMLHLKTVAEHSSFNKMQEDNLSRVFAPTICYTSNITELGNLQLISAQIQCLQALISLPKEFWQNILAQPKVLSEASFIR